MQELELLLDIAGEDRALRIVAAVGRPSVQEELGRLISQRLAARLLSSRTPRSAIRDRLIRRGMSPRSAYRVITAALSSGPFTCAMDPHSLARSAHILASRNQSEEEVTTDIQALQTTLDDLRARHSQIDVAAGRRRLALASKARDSLSRHEAGPGGQVFGPDPVAQARRAEVDAAVIEFKAARSALQTLEADERALRGEIESLEAMIAGEIGIAAAKAAVERADARVAEAAELVTSAEAAVDRITQMIVDEERDFEASRSASATKLLAAVKAGSDPTKVPTANRDKVNVFELARVAAQAELEAARGALASAMADRVTAQAETHRASALVAQRAHMVLLPSYRDALVDYITAHIRAYGVRPPVPNVVAEADAIVQRRSSV